ncbi:hypothetical protein FGO68_gene6310 [Halteria grandinella]|uniref:Phosphoglycerate mutase n=1 Tax=Halteria grandinella TaxID=5974 RepID=A0A8J8SWX5_HALGN|nr:hypothetical protein FGO68_gene6310 [Halteria grandinella]
MLFVGLVEFANILALFRVAVQTDYYQVPPMNLSTQGPLGINTDWVGALAGGSIVFFGQMKPQLWFTADQSTICSPWMLGCFLGDDGSTRLVAAVGGMSLIIQQIKLNIIMRVLLVRHGQSTNNELRAQLQSLYEHNRTEDPDLSERGVRESLELGRTFKSLGIKLDGIMTTAFLRSVKSAHFIREGYQGAEAGAGEGVEVRLFNKMHEKGGCYMAGQPKPGMSKQKTLEIMPDLVIDEKETIDDEGWWKAEKVETTLQCIERVKEVIKEFKELYRDPTQDNKNKTFLAVTHGAFLNTLACVFTNNIASADQDFFIPENNSVTILDIEEVQQNHKQFVDCKLTAFNLKIKSP